MNIEEAKDILLNIIADEVIGTYCIEIQKEVDCSKNCENEDCYLIQAIETVLNELEKKDKEIEHQIEKRNNQKEELAILNEKQKEFNKLTNTLKSYKGQFKRQQNELEKKDKVINEMSDFINEMSNELIAETGANNLEFCKTKKCIDNGEIDCKDCIKEYFTNKAENVGE